MTITHYFRVSKNNVKAVFVIFIPYTVKLSYAMPKTVRQVCSKVNFWHTWKGQVCLGMKKFN